jgi:type VI secretion system secreted protein Hcp
MKKTLTILIALSLLLISFSSIAYEQFVDESDVINLTSVQILLKISGVYGESIIAGHEGEIDVLAWRWGATQSGTMHVGGGGGSGKVNVEDLSLTKLVDKASIGLLRSCFNGSHFDEAILTVRKSGENPHDYLVITMSDVLVTSINTGESAAADIITENVTFNFAKVKVSYTPLDAEGNSGSAIEFTWNIEKNVEE